MSKRPAISPTISRARIALLKVHGFSRAISPTESIPLQSLRESLPLQESLSAVSITRSRFFLRAILTGILATIAGCHSRFVEVTIDNQGPAALRLIEVDYPSASFGVGSIAPNSQFHYHFKIQGSGPVKIEFTDAHGKTHNVDGPDLNQGQEGRLTIAIDAAGKVTWQTNLNVPN